MMSTATMIQSSSLEWKKGGTHDFRQQIWRRHCSFLREKGKKSLCCIRSHRTLLSLINIVEHKKVEQIKHAFHLGKDEGNIALLGCSEVTFSRFIPHIMSSPAIKRVHEESLNYAGNNQLF